VLIEAADRPDPKDPVEFDPFSDTFFDDPYEMYRRLREEAPVYHSERYGFWALSRYDDLVAAHKDWRTFSSTHGVDLHTLRRDPAEIASFRSIIMMDPPDHDRLRALVSRVFTPRAVQALEPMVREVVDGFAAAIGDARRFDGVADLSAPFPVEIISRILGVPAADRQQIRLWLDESLHREPGNPAPTPEGIEAMTAQGAYFYGLVQEKRRNPADDMLSRLAQVEVEREDGSTTGLDDVEIAGFASLLGGAGAETVTKLVGNAFVLFGRHPDQWRKVVDDPGAIPGAVEEILRYLPPSQYQGRFSLRESEWRGEVLPAGQPVLLLTGAATRDPSAYPDPDRFDITRKPGQALGFGLGIHSCLGAALARMESRVAIEAMVRLWPRFSVDEANLRRVHMSNVAGYSSVPVQVGSP
jgi:cytochrome P450